MDAIVTTSYIFFTFSFCNGHSMHSTVFSASELINDKITNNTGAPKLALRYGFHRTSECNDYEKAFLCIQKCVDHGFDIAYADKYCFCTCYVKPEKAKYTMPHKFDKTRWKLGAPKTTKPAWIQKLEDANPIITTKSVKDKTKKLIVKDNQNGDDKTETIYTHHAHAIVKSTIIDRKTTNDATGGEHTSSTTNKIDIGKESNVTLDTSIASNITDDNTINKIEMGEKNKANDSLSTPSVDIITVGEQTANATNGTQFRKESNITLDTTIASTITDGKATDTITTVNENGTVNNQN